MDADGCLALVEGFWRQVQLDLHPSLATAPLAALRASTLAWLDGVSDEPGSFLWWCRLGGTDLDPDRWRELLRSAPVVVRGQL